MKSHAWQVTTTEGQQAVLFVQGGFGTSSNVVKKSFRNAEEVRYRGEQKLPTFRGRPARVPSEETDDNEVVSTSGKAKHAGGMKAQRREITGAARQRLLKQLAAARKVRAQNLKG
jgi:hypothetical protein